MRLRMNVLSDPPTQRQADAPTRLLSALAPLSTEEIALVRGLARRGETLPAKTEILAEGELIGRPLLLLSGWVCRQRLLLDGRRQILTFLLPGDLIGMKPWPQPRALSSVMTLGGVTVVDATPLREAFSQTDPQHPGLRAACAAAAGLEQMRLSDHIMRLGRQTAYERVAHLLLELHERLSLAGLVESKHFSMPLTQEAMADALGLSIVHVNRTLQQLRRDNLVDVKSGICVLHDIKALARIADFRGCRVLEDGGVAWASGLDYLGD